MAHPCPSCGNPVSVWSARAEAECAKCHAQLRIRNYGLALFMAIFVAPIPAYYIALQASSGEETLMYYAIQFVLSLVFGAAAFYLFASVGPRGEENAL